jgi:hypothetical protein
LRERKVAAGQVKVKDDRVKDSEEHPSDQTPPKAEASTSAIQRRQRPASRSRLTPIVENDEPLENITTRLRRTANELLTEAALRQRLKKESPSTRQDIVQEALEDWFRKRGYAPSDE